MDFLNTLLTLYGPVVTVYSTSLIFNNLTICPHSCIYVFCVDLRKTAIISLYRIN